MKHLQVGEYLDHFSRPEIPLSDVARHMLVLGSTGSGKTYLAKAFIEEVALAGVPVIAIDTQGDVASLALSPFAWWHQRVDVRVWSIGSDCGLQLGLPAPPVSMNGHTSYETAKLEEGAVEDLAFTLNLSAKDRWVAEHTPIIMRAYGTTDLLTFARKIVGGEAPLHDLPHKSHVILRASDLYRTYSGAFRGFLESSEAYLYSGTPLSIPTLIPSPSSLSVVYINPSLEDGDKARIIKGVGDQICNWMYGQEANGSLRLLFFIDEAAPYIPPSNRKDPPCKESLMRVFRQGRKYGVGCMVATQSPGDLDYRAFDQFYHWFVGRITAPTALKKVKAAVPGDVSQITQLVGGEFIHVTAGTSMKFKARTLYTDHRTLWEEEIRRLPCNRESTQGPTYSATS